MTGDELISLAGKFVANTNLGGSEAQFRNAISRAYYGAFHLAKTLLEEINFPIKENPKGIKRSIATYGIAVKVMPWL